MYRLALWLVRVVALVVTCVGIVDLWSAWWGHWFGIHVRMYDGQSAASIDFEKARYLLFHSPFLIWYLPPILLGVALFVLTFLRLPSRK